MYIEDDDDDVLTFTRVVTTTVEPRYNEVPRDRKNYFVISGFCYKRNPDITKLPK